MEQFDVYVAGFEVPEDRAVSGLVHVFGMSQSSAQNFVRSLPRMGKRNQSHEAAERYARALRAIGGMVQVQQSKAATPSTAPPSGERARMTSLPPPAARLSEIAKQWGIDLQTPVIPKAANVPSELVAASQAPIAAAAQADWVEPDPVDAVRKVTASVPAPLSVRPPQEPTLVATANPPATEVAPIALHDSVANSRSKWPPRPDHVGRVERSVPPPPAPAKPDRTVPILVALVVAVGLGLGAGVKGGWFETEADRLERAFAEDGIEPGRYEDAATFVERLGASIDGLQPDALQDLLDGLRRSGAKRVWAVGVRDEGAAPVAAGLVVELPSDPEARSTVYFQHVRRLSPQTPEPTKGQRYLRLAF